VVGFASPDARADSAARRMANFELSAKRSEAVSRELSRLGVPAGVITASAESGGQRYAQAGGGFGAAGERRVDIYLDY
jgi:flagellar motor protein MotB